MRDVKIILQPFDFISILVCKIHKTLNDHTLLSFEGRISIETEKKIMMANIKNTSVTLKVYDENNKAIEIFVGIIKEFSIKIIGDTRNLNLDCISATHLMDIKKQTRVFQNKSSTYEDVIMKLGSSYENFGCIMSVGDGVEIKDLIVQYGETDFEFINRLASHFNCSICPAYLDKGAKFYFGMPKSSKKIVVLKDYVVKKELSKDLQKDEKTLSYSIEQGSTILEMESRDIYEIGDSTKFMGNTYIIADIKSELNGNEFIHLYTLKEETGLYKSTYYNLRIIGASLESTISSVANDTVKVEIHVDGIQDTRDWFPYSTVYSSPDGTGWYCMPEISDSVRLYFPTEKEKQGYIISAVHVVSDENSGTTINPSYDSEIMLPAPRTDPDYKSLKSKYDKEVLFTPKSILFRSGNEMIVQIHDDDGISIISDKRVNIESGTQIDMLSTTNSINLTATEAIHFVQAGTKIDIEETIKLSGAKVQME